MITGSTLNNINSTLASMQRTSQELSSGKTILEPSDNPYGASRVIDLQGQLEGLSSYASNTQDGISWENTAGSAMASISQAVERVRELLVEASNGTINQSDRETIALEVEQLTEAVKQDANAQYAGQSVFSGTLTTTAPYQQGANDEYQGNGETISRAVGPGATVTISTNISTCSATAKHPATASCSTRCGRSPSTCAAAPPKPQRAQLDRPERARREHRNAQPAAGDGRLGDQPAADRAQP